MRWSLKAVGVTTDRQTMNACLECPSRAANRLPTGLLIIAFLLLLVLPSICRGSENESTTADAASQARAMDSAHRADALKLLEDRLAAKPGDTDARTLYGMMLSWDGRYAEARQQLKIVLAAHPGDGDALLPLVHVELWSGHSEETERLARQGLESDPNNADLLMAQANAFKAMKRLREAKQSAGAALHVDPSDQGAKDLQEETADALLQWEMWLIHTSDWFSAGRVPWREDQMQLNDQTESGPVIALFSAANRFNEGSQQGEIEYYPHFRPGTYAFLNAGYSPDARLYPRYRVGADVFQSIGHGFEVTGGYRYLAFGAGINIYMAALTNYYGQWMFTGRTYITPDSIGNNRPYQLSIRRYLGDGRDYWTVRGGWGSAPSEIQNVTDNAILSSSRVFAEFSHVISRRITFVIWPEYPSRTWSVFRVSTMSRRRQTSTFALNEQDKSVRNNLSMVNQNAIGLSSKWKTVSTAGTGKTS